MCPDGENKMMLVYHFTSTAHLPWILDTGELRPSKITTRLGYPEDFLWATSNPEAARSSQVLHNRVFGYRDGRVWLVRFTLSADHFEPWPQAPKRNPAWEDADIQRIQDGSQGDDPAEWRTHCGPLDRADWIAIHARPCDGEWREVPTGLTVHRAVNPDTGFPCRTIIWRARHFTSMRVAENPATYECGIADMLSGAMAA
jgi:hypothetical protein